MRLVLVIDDNPSVAQALRILLGLHDIRTIAASSPQQGLEMLSQEQVDLVIADMNFSADTTSGEEGIALFRALRAAQPDIPVILLTGWTHLESAVQLVKAGAADYMAKPWDDDKLVSTVENLLELGEATREREQRRYEGQRRREQLSGRYDLCGLIFVSDAMERVVELACRVSRAQASVLITGPNGVGKEKIAQIVHANSSVRNGPFVAVNCGAIPSELVEAELFGVEAGAYTGVQRARRGRFEVAAEGTLFLDEIGNMPLAGQVKLLRVLETGQYEMLGSSTSRSSRARILSATNSVLTEAVRAGTFREDLFYRLNVFEIAVPPLSERTDDILPLARHFLGGDLHLTDEAVSALTTYDWPGNVRELRNLMERVKVMVQQGTVGVGDLALPRRLPHPGTNEVQGRRVQLSREVIEASLREAGGNISRAAQSLGLSRQALYRRIERFDLQVPADDE
jgi:DNA-binding NtrC family response regulator